MEADLCKDNPRPGMDTSQSPPKYCAASLRPTLRLTDRCTCRLNTEILSRCQYLLPLPRQSCRPGTWRCRVPSRWKSIDSDPYTGTDCPNKQMRPHMASIIVPLLPPLGPLYSYLCCDPLQWGKTSPSVDTGIVCLDSGMETHTRPFCYYAQCGL